MTVERLEGVRKLSQNKPFAARARVAAQLAAAADASDRAVAALMQDG
jgi:predicted FMN-binding regulatory protein PaiB